jgi:hypothetical protein
MENPFANNRADYSIQAWAITPASQNPDLHFS